MNRRPARLHGVFQVSTTSHQIIPRARAAAQNIIPASTGAASAVGKVLQGARGVTRVSEEQAGELDLPVLIHVADPIAFFDPVDETNERWDELHNHPDWAWTSPPFPPFLEILDGLASLVTRHPRTTFIGAHVGGYAENLAWVGDLLDRCPNFHVDIADRIAGGQVSPLLEPFVPEHEVR